MQFVKKVLLIILPAMMMASCGTVEEFVLLNDLNTDAFYKMATPYDLKIKRGDNLQIMVSHKVPQITEMFNHALNNTGTGQALNQFTVNNQGYINFPMLDTLKAEGLSCSELERDIASRIESIGLASSPTVNVRITNFKVTVIGESGTGVYEFESSNVTLLDLVAKANLVQSNMNSGFQSGQGIRRDKILVMREVNGVLTSEFVSLLSKDVFYSPYFYLQQNDIVYVWPSKSSIRSSNKLFDYWWGRLSVVTTAVSAVSLLISILGTKKK